MTAEPTTDDARAQALGTRLFLASLAAAELMTVYLGVELGLYSAFPAEAVSAEQFAVAAGLDARYAREWLEQQAAAGIVEVDGANEPASRRRFVLPAPHRQALTDRSGPFGVTALAVLPLGAIAPALPHLLHSMRSGAGLTAAAYGAALAEAQRGMNRPVFEHDLPRWIRAALPDIHQALRRPGGAIADVGCGAGTSSLALARTYPAAVVHGFDIDGDAIAAARAAVPPTAGARVSFEVRDMTVPPQGSQRYDLICVLDTLHDLPHPVDLLRGCREMLKPHGAVLVMEARVGPEFTAPASETERFTYAVSVLHCLPIGRHAPGSAATGAVLRPQTLGSYAAAAGFGRTTALEVRHRFHRLYRLDP